MKSFLLFNYDVDLKNGAAEWNHEVKQIYKDDATIHVWKSVRETDKKKRF